MSTQQILKEYLLSLGWKIDEPSSKRFDFHLSKFDKQVVGLAKGLLAAGAAAQVMVGLFARSMEKLYYASQRTNSTASNLRALDYAAEQAGVSADTMRGAVENMAKALKANPGMAAWLKNLGVETEGRQTVDMLLDLVDKLKEMPTYVRGQIGEAFGIDSTTLEMLIASGAELRKSMELRKQMAAAAGLDEERAMRNGKEYMQLLREITAQFGVLKDVALDALLPVFKIAAEGLKSWLADVSKMIGDANAGRNGGWAGAFQRFGENTKDWFDKAFVHPEAAKTRKKKDRPTSLPDDTVISSPDASKRAAPGKVSAQTFLRNLEDSYGLPDGLLDAIWDKESGRGKYMRSPKGAKGHFGFMDPTAKEMGLSNPDDFNESARAAAKYLAKMLQWAGGDLDKALAGYNWGMGNVDKKGLANAPWETRDYVSSVGQRVANVQQNNTFTIHSPDPATAAQKVGKVVNTQWADVTRNLAGATR